MKDAHFEGRPRSEEEEAQSRDSDRIDEEEAALLAWGAQQDNLTGEEIDEQIQKSQARLVGIDVEDLKFYARKIRWRLLEMTIDRQRSADSLDDIVEPTDEVLAEIEKRTSHKKKRKKEGV